MRKTKHDMWLKNGKEQFVVVPIKEYEAMRALMEDDADFRAIEASKKRQASSPRTSLEQVERELGLAQKRRKSQV